MKHVPTKKQIIIIGILREDNLSDIYSFNGFFSIVTILENLNRI